MKVWYKKDFLGKDKPTKSELINDFYWSLFTSSFLLICCFIFSFVAIAEIRFVGPAIIVGILSILYFERVHGDKESYYLFYGMRGK